MDAEGHRDPDQQFAPDDDVRQRIARLRQGEEPFDVVPAVMRRIEQERPRLPLRMIAAMIIAALCLGLVGTAILAPSALKAAGNWLKTFVIREGPAPGPPNASSVTVGTTGPGGNSIGELREDVRRAAVSFPVTLPQSVLLALPLRRASSFDEKSSQRICWLRIWDLPSTVGRRKHGLVHPDTDHCCIRPTLPSCL